MPYSFHNKTFRVLRNDGPGAEVNENTVFHFRQMDDVVHADYFGGKVKMGKLIGLLEGDRIRFRYVQVNENGEFHAGHSVDRIETTADGKIRLIDEWEWETKTGKGFCILEES